MKTVSIRLSDSDCAALQESLRETGQTAQAFYETFTKAVIREGSIPDIIRASASEHAPHDRIDSFERLEPLRKSAGRYLPADFDPDDVSIHAPSRERRQTMPEQRRDSIMNSAGQTLL